MITLCSVLMFAGLGLVVDLGFGYYRFQAQRAAAESAADAAALAAKTGLGTGTAFTCNSTYAVCQSATACPAQLSSSTNVQAGCLYAQANGYTAGGNSGRQNVTMTSSTGSPPNVSGLFASYYVTATVSDSLPQLFSAVFGHNRYLNPSVSATAAVILGTAGGCIYALDPSASSANDYTETGGSTVVKTTCGVYVNSSDSKALVVSGGATLTVTGATNNVVGGYNVSGGSTISPVPNTGVSAAADPFASVPTPTITTPVSCAPSNTNYTLSGGSATISPGTYCGGITNNGGTLTFKSGLYILYGGGLTSTSSSGDLIGSGVTFYNTAGGSYSYKPITISGGGNATLSAMTTGSQAGMLFFEDPTITSSSKNTISGGSTTTLSGAMYFKNDNITYSGGSSLSAQAITLVANTVTISGGSSISGYNNGVGGQTTTVAIVQ